MPTASLDLKQQAANEIVLDSVDAVNNWAKYKYDEGLELKQPVVSAEVVDQVVASLRSEISAKNKTVTSTGRAVVQEPFGRQPFDTTGLSTPEGQQNVNARLLQFVVDYSPSIETHWSFIIPATLNLFDNIKLQIKVKALYVAQVLAHTHRARLEAFGLVPVFWETITPLLEMVPPSVEPEDSQIILGATIGALLALAGTDKPKQNYVIRRGPLSALNYTNKNVAFTIFLLNQLSRVVEHLKSQTIAHLKEIVRVFQAITYDPFIDMSPDLITAACDMMATVIRYAWPRLDAYKYDVLLGLARAKALDSECSELLQKACSLQDDAQKLKEKPVDTA